MRTETVTVSENDHSNINNIFLLSFTVSVLIENLMMVLDENQNSKRKFLFGYDKKNFLD